MEYHVGGLQIFHFDRVLGALLFPMKCDCGMDLGSDRWKRMNDLLAARSSRKRFRFVSASLLVIQSNCLLPQVGTPLPNTYGCLLLRLDAICTFQLAKNGSQLRANRFFTRKYPAPVVPKPTPVSPACDELNLLQKTRRSCPAATFCLFVVCWCECVRFSSFISAFASGVLTK